jgi:ABC-type transporter Mla MlaB component
VLALILRARRTAAGQKRQLHLSGLPTAVTTLADLYGVSELLQA